MMSIRTAARGFTLIEMLVVVALVGVLAAAAQPLVEVSLRRAQDTELRRGLRQLRTAIDAHKQAWDEGRIERQVGDSGYPPSLERLVDGVTDITTQPRARIHFLRRLPRDPYAPADLPAAQTWGLRAYESPPEAPQPGRDVFDVYSMSEGRGLDGQPHRQW